MSLLTFASPVVPWQAFGAVSRDLRAWVAVRDPGGKTQVSASMAIPLAPGGPRRIVFHIGLEKTGTTSFQRFCVTNRTALLRQGLLYPRRIIGRGINHKLLAASYLQDRPKDRALAVNVPPRGTLLRAIRAEAEAGGAPTVLLSAEHLSSRFDAAAIAALACDFADADAMVLVAVRDHQARLVSSYTSYVLGGGRETFAAYEAGILSDGGRYLSVRDTLEPWLAVFGRARVQVLDYDAEPDIIGALLRACDVATSPGDVSAHRDLTSPRAEVVLAINAVNRAIAGRQSVSAHESDRAWLQLIAFSVLLRKRTIGAASALGPRQLALSPEGRRAVDAIAARDRAWLAETFDLAMGGAAPRRSAPPATQAATLEPDALAETLVRRIPRSLWLVSEGLVGAPHPFARLRSVVAGLGARRGR